MAIRQTRFSDEILLLRPVERGSTPLFFHPVSAGFPSPADDFIEKLIDLNEHLVENPVATFFHKIRGNHWSSIGLSDGDRLIIDRSLEPIDKSFVIADVEGVRGLYIVRIIGGRTTLWTCDGKELVAETESVIWGVVTYAIRRLRL